MKCVSEDKPKIIQIVYTFDISLLFFSKSFSVHLTACEQNTMRLILIFIIFMHCSCVIISLTHTLFFASKLFCVIFFVKFIMSCHRSYVKFGRKENVMNKKGVETDEQVVWIQTDRHHSQCPKIRYFSFTNQNDDGCSATVAFASIVQHRPTPFIMGHHSAHA